MPTPTVAARRRNVRRSIRLFHRDGALICPPRRLLRWVPVCKQIIHPRLHATLQRGAMDAPCAFELLGPNQNVQRRGARSSRLPFLLKLQVHRALHDMPILLMVPVVLVALVLAALVLAARVLVAMVLISVVLATLGAAAAGTRWIARIRVAASAAILPRQVSRSMGDVRAIQKRLNGSIPAYTGVSPLAGRTIIARAACDRRRTQRAAAAGTGTAVPQNLK
jgi:hypothetical protein